VNGPPPPRMEGGRTILYLHGGYYVFGSIHSHRNLAGNIAAGARARALIIAYRLGPEHPFPAAPEDALTAYRWLLAQDRRPHQITLVGDSAGGGLVLALLLSLRDRGEPLPAAAVCLSPVTDLTLSGESWKTNDRKDAVIERQVAEEARSMYVARTNPCEPLCSPLFADLHGLPPLLIQVGSDEVFLSDSTCFAEHARAAGVDVTLEVWRGMQHVWQYSAPFVPEARQAINRIGEFIKAASG
jgi:monoterpene epsilon-lactone hydrolase